MGIHTISKEKKSSYIIKDGRCYYSVVLPDNPKPLEQKAADELIYFFREATGITLPVVHDGELQFRPELHCFSVGNTKMIKFSNIYESQLEIDKKTLGEVGGRVVSYGWTVFMFGATDRGTLNAVYEFLRFYFHFDCYFTDFYSIDRNVTELPYYSLDIIETPDITYHNNGYRFIRGDLAYRWHRFSEIIPVNGFDGHNVFEYVDVKNNLKKHPLWFDNPDKPLQLCFTAHGDEKEYEAMLSQCFETLKKALKECPYNIVRFAMQDVVETCQCKACRENAKKYKSESASVILLLNRLKKMVDDWFMTDEGKPYARKLKIVFYAYIDFEAAPARLDEKGNYVAIDESVKCADGVVPMLCFIEMKYTRSPKDPVNKKWYDITRAWHACANELHFYFYDTNFHYYLTPYDSFTCMREYYQMVVDNNSTFLHNLGQPHNAHPTGFSILKGYLESKLAWDMKSDLDKYTDKFFRNFFGDACEPMRKLYDSWRKVAYDQPRKYGYGERRNVEVYAIPLSKKLWDKKTLTEWLDLTDKAMAAISHLTATDFPMYCKYAENIIAERIFVKYLLIEVYGETYDESTLLTMKKSVRKDCEYVGITNWNEQENASFLWKSWGI